MADEMRLASPTVQCGDDAVHGEHEWLLLGAFRSQCPGCAEQPEPCCDLHGRNCEQGGEECCEHCTEAHHFEIGHGGVPCSSPDLSAAQPEDGGW